MSHFTVLVVLPNGSTLDAALQPFHEYESTGVHDAHVVFVDREDEYRADFAKPQIRWRDPADGHLYCGYEDVFFRGATEHEKAKLGSVRGSGYAEGIQYTTFYDKYRDGDAGVRLMVHMDPSVLGFERVEVAGEAAHGPFEAWVKEEYSAEQQGGRWGRVTNPNAKWDWWKVGGRWSGLLLLKQGASGVKGEPGLNPNIGSPESTTQADKNGVDIARVGDVDFASMKIRNVRKRRECVDAGIAEVMKAQGITREEVVARWCAFTRAVVAARRAWEAEGSPGRFYDYMVRLDLPGLTKDHRKPDVAFLGDSFSGSGVPEGCADLEAYITGAPALSTFAVLKDGKWYERGRMGGWAAVHDEKDPGAWAQEYDKLLAELDPDATIAVVDCHG